MLRIFRFIRGVHWNISQHEEVSGLTTFMCEQQATTGSQIGPDCFEVLDSLGRRWAVYQLRQGLVSASECADIDGIQICDYQDLAERLGRMHVEMPAETN